MFHYRLAPSNNRPRMLVAVFLAVAVHMGLMIFEFAPKPVFVPSVSLPRSVSIFLQQSRSVQTPDEPLKKIQDVRPVKEEQFPAGKEPELPVLQKAAAAIRQPENSMQPPALLQEKAKLPAVEEIMPAYQSAEDIAADLMPEAGEAAKVQVPTIQAEAQTAPEEDGVILPGTVQLAYPRYQLNSPPTYPGLARKRGQEGTVIMQVLVNREGRVDELQIDVSSNFTLLDRAAATAVRKWSFEPAWRGKERVPMWVRVPVTFKLKK